jgi:hypothetical protein
MKAMKKSLILVIALLCTPAASHAQGGSYDRDRYFGDRYAAQDSQSVYTGLQGYGRVIHNANDCAPDRAEPVWGGGLAPVGYACVTPSANGN